MFILPGVVSATNYYVDATNGNDSNTGLFDVQAWKIGGEVNGTNFKAGDDVYFFAGEIWSGT
jgi:hypothetical protein